MDHQNSNLLIQEVSAAKNLSKMLEDEESLLKQKSRNTWLKLGDGNNSFFFNQTKNHWNRNKKISIKNEMGEVIHGHSQVASVAVNYFRDSLGTSAILQSTDLSGISCPQVTTLQASMLSAPITNDIIYSTLKNFKPNKAPGL